MSKSLDFILERCKDPQSPYYDRKWQDAIRLPVTGDLFNSLFGVTADNVSVRYDPDAEFEYFVSSSSRHDGTLLFELETMGIVANKICSGASYFAPTPPLSDRKTYIIGDLVLLNEYGEEFGTQEKPWMRMRTTVCLPVKVVYDSTDATETNTRMQEGGK